MWILCVQEKTREKTERNNNNRQSDLTQDLGNPKIFQSISAIAEMQTDLYTSKKKCKRTNRLYFIC